ncbi:CRISPR-associated protein Cas2 [Nitrosococcus halophilus Nc 4]|uniref:CRISPR-associated endoribonuclease Cas2 n=1 Tax=Nitrosococcus halophilus (strain Nc4) TaxID=472759 RepID=D5BYK3_NITHN|nr:CRISPR-associated endonuclease Cas2 [Nitrosococcus halophilus]ADE15991.1 CRISPR-associated protein Cas2 [Nitrosococcus halophilus Nc 4]
MYMLITYDVDAKRTEKFKKLLRRYLNHDQYSVFSGDITEAEAIRLHRELSRLMVPGDRVTEVTAANRRNINVTHLSKSDSGKGEMKRVPVEDHRRDFSVL